MADVPKRVGLLSFRQKIFVPFSLCCWPAAVVIVSLSLDSVTLPPSPRIPFASVLPLTDTTALETADTTLLLYSFFRILVR